MTDPGNINKGMCIKCKIPLMVDLPDENRLRLLCLDCTKEVQAKIKRAKNNPNIRRFVIKPNTYTTKRT